MAPRFSLHRRRGRWYAQLYSEDLGKYLTARCTGAESRNEALLVVSSWLQDGWPTGRHARPRPVHEAIALGTILSQLRTAPLTAEDAGRILAVLKDRELISGGVVKAGPGAELLTDFLARFWDYERSPYVREKVAHGQRIGKRRCYDATTAIKAHWAPAFQGRRLAEITRRDIQDFGLTLRDGGLCGKSVNNVREYGTVALRWAYQNSMIPADPTAGVRRFSGVPKARGVLTLEEAAALFRVTWTDERARIGNLVAMDTALRAGEVIGLQLRDIGEDRIYIRHSWSEEDGLKGTKTNEERTVPLPHGLRDELLALVASNPHGPGEDRFLFYSADPDRPMRTEILRDGLNEALLTFSLPRPEDRADKAKVREAVQDWRARGVCFHSWRHYASTHMANAVDQRAMLVTGHRTRSVFEHYANHATEAQFQQVAAAAEKLFSNVVPFREAVS